MLCGHLNLNSDLIHNFPESESKTDESIQSNSPVISESRSPQPVQPGTTQAVHKLDALLWQIMLEGHATQNRQESCDRYCRQVICNLSDQGPVCWDLDEYGGRNAKDHEMFSVFNLKVFMF